MPLKRQYRFWKRRAIVSLIGIDYAILERSEHNNLPKFYFAGFLILGIFILSFLSIFYAFDLLFSMWHAEILLSTFFSLMFCTIYVFLIQTFSKEVFPTSKKMRFFNLSNLSRIGFVVMIGFIMAQPVKIWVYRHQLDKDIMQYRSELYRAFTRANTRLYSADIHRLRDRKAWYRSLPDSAAAEHEIGKINRSLHEINRQIAYADLKAGHAISSSHFFIKRIELTGRYPFAHSLVLLLTSLFFLPILLIYSISGKSRYYELKKKNEKRLVLENYSRFKQAYTFLLDEKYGLKAVQFYEPFSDPPFNTSRKPQPACLSQEDFLNHLEG